MGCNSPSIFFCGLSVLLEIDRSEGSSEKREEVAKKREEVANPSMVGLIMPRELLPWVSMFIVALELIFTILSPTLVHSRNVDATITRLGRSKLWKLKKVSLHECPARDSFKDHEIDSSDIE